MFSEPYDGQAPDDEPACEGDYGDDDCPDCLAARGAWDEIESRWAPWELIEAPRCDRHARERRDDASERDVHSYSSGNRPPKVDPAAGR